MNTTIFIDGSCSRDGTMRVALTHGRYYIVKNIGTGGNSNIAEYNALLYALLYIQRKELKNVTIISDFLSLVQQMNGKCKVRSPTMKFYFEKASQMIEQCPTINILHVKRNNNLAGKLF